MFDAGGSSSPIMCRNIQTIFEITCDLEQWEVKVNLDPPTKKTHTP